MNSSDYIEAERHGLLHTNDEYTQRRRTSMRTNIPTSDLLSLLRAIGLAFPHGKEKRDRFGRYSPGQGALGIEALRQLAVRWQIKNGGYDTMDQLGMIARKMLLWDEQYEDGAVWADQQAKEMDIVGERR